MSYIEEWRQEFKGKRILIWGLGMEGKSSYRFIRSILPEQSIDLADQVVSSFIEETINTTFFLENDCPFESYDLILKAPGIVVKEEYKDLPISGQAPLFLKHYRDRIIGVTGTKGKSTTTSLIYEVLNKKQTTHLVGNIGKACFDVIPEMKEDDLIAFEISCHQLEFAKHSPHIAVYLNLYEEHLDHYGSFEKYGAAKDKIFQFQKEGDLLFIKDEIKERANREDAYLIGKDVYVENHRAHFKEKEVSLENIHLIGKHNELNLAIVYAIANYYGVSDEEYKEAIQSFLPLPHRLQKIGEKDGIVYVDDSISTIGQSCINALESLKETGSVLIGGMDRGIDYSDLKHYLHTRNDLHIIFMYQSGKRVYEEMKEENLLPEQVYLVEDLEEAVTLAKQCTGEGKICLLSPAASSYDHFKNFEERGEVFKQLVFGYVESN